MDVVDYVRRLEEALIRVCHDLGVTDAGRVEGRSGVWLPAQGFTPERKVAAIGVRIAGGVPSTASRSTATPTWATSAGSCRAGSPTPV